MVIGLEIHLGPETRYHRDRSQSSTVFYYTGLPGLGIHPVKARHHLTSDSRPTHTRVRHYGHRTRDTFWSRDKIPQK